MKARRSVRARRRTFPAIFACLPLLVFLSAAPPAAASVSGSLDAAGCAIIYGWAWDSSNPLRGVVADSETTPPRGWE
jgi:hypothetical protein